MGNTLVHTVMYSYYAISALGPRYRRYLWWKKYLTVFQMVIKIFMIRHNKQILLVTVYHCDKPYYQYRCSISKLQLFTCMDDNNNISRYPFSIYVCRFFQVSIHEGTIITREKSNGERNYGKNWEKENLFFSSPSKTQIILECCSIANFISDRLSDHWLSSSRVLAQNQK